MSGDEKVHLDFRCLRCGSLTERIRDRSECSKDFAAERSETVFHACHDGGVGFCQLVGLHDLHGPGGGSPT